MFSNRFCNDPFWDTNFTLNGRYPDLTRCFQYSLLSFLPSSLLIITFPLYVYHLKHYGKNHRPYNITSLSLTKMFLSVTMAIVTMCELVFRLINANKQLVISEILFTGLLIISYCLVAYLQHYERTKGVWSSGYLFNFWLLCLCFLIVFIWSFSTHFYAYKRVPYALTIFVLHVCQLILVLSQLILHCFNSKSGSGADSTKFHFLQNKFGSAGAFDLLSAQDKYNQDDHIRLSVLSKNECIMKTCPEVYASFVSRITFSWFNKLARYGSRHPLTKGDLWLLPDKNVSARLAPIFEREWKSYLLKTMKKAYIKYLKKKSKMSPKQITEAKRLAYDEMDQKDSNKHKYENNYFAYFNKVYKPSLQSANLGVGQVFTSPQSQKLIDSIDDYEIKYDGELSQNDNINTTPSSTKKKYEEARKTQLNRKLSRTFSLPDQDYHNKTFINPEEFTRHTGIKVKPSLVPPLASCFKLLVFQALFYKTLSDLGTFLNPQLLSLLITFVSKKHGSIWVGIFYTIAMFVVATFNTLILHHYFHIVFVIGLRIKAMLINAVYEKALKLSNAARKSSTVGEIVNLMSVDTQKVCDVCSYACMIWSAPLQITVCTIFLWRILGPSILAGLLVMVLLIPLNGYMANCIKKLQTEQMKLKDQRIKVMNEVLNGVKVIKLYAWELSFEDKILAIRNKEINVLKRIAMMNSFTSFVWSCAPYVVSCITFACYVLISPKNILDAKKAFVSMSLFNILRFPLSMLPMIITYIIEARVSLKRLTNFLLKDELEPDCVKHEPMFENSKNSNYEVIKVVNGNFGWDLAPIVTTKPDDKISPDTKEDIPQKSQNNLLNSSAALESPTSAKRRKQQQEMKQKIRHSAPYKVYDYVKHYSIPNNFSLHTKKTKIQSHTDDEDELIHHKTRANKFWKKKRKSAKLEQENVSEKSHHRIRRYSKDDTCIDEHKRSMALKLLGKEQIIKEKMEDKKNKMRPVSPLLLPANVIPPSVLNDKKKADNKENSKGKGLDSEYHGSVPDHLLDIAPEKSKQDGKAALSNDSTIIPQKLDDENTTHPSFSASNTSTNTTKESGLMVVLKDINLSIYKGELVAIVGSVGSGKSSLISAMLGEMKRIDTCDMMMGVDDEDDVFKTTSTKDSLTVNQKIGQTDPSNVPLLLENRISMAKNMTPTTNPKNEYAGYLSPFPTCPVLIRGTVAYASQQAWIRNATFKQNVIFDAPFPYDDEAYEAALETCALTHDRDSVLPDGDATEIGEKGVNLSGGQKQRLALARSVYRMHMIDTFLLDDPLSAVDVHVGRHIFNRVIGPSGVLKDKTRVLVTNAIHLLPHVNRIVVMKDGRIVEQGTYKELSARMDGVFSEIVKNYLSDRMTQEDNKQSTPPTPLKGENVEKINASISKVSDTVSTNVDDSQTKRETKKSVVSFVQTPKDDDSLYPESHFNSSPPNDKTLQTFEITQSQEDVRKNSDPDHQSTIITSPSSLVDVPNGDLSVALPLLTKNELNEEQLKTSKSTSENSQNDNISASSMSKFNTNNNKSMHSSTKSSLKQSKKSNNDIGLTANEMDNNDKKGDKNHSPHQLTTTETSETGRVKFSVYLTYFKALKYHITIFVFILYGVYYALSVAANFWLSQWSDDMPINKNGTMIQDIPLRNKRLRIYAIYGLLQGIAIMGATVVVALSMINAARALHAKMLRNILQSPMTFFDSTPLGRIVNRFAKDMDTLDNVLPHTIRSWISTFYGVLTTLIVICVSTPTFLAAVLPIAFVYFLILRYYIPTSRQLKRLESVARSPIYSHFQETLLGASTIRAYGVTDQFIKESQKLVDENQMCYYPALVSNRWLAVRLELIGSFITFFSALSVVLGRDRINPGQAGLAISYALSVTQSLNWLVRMTCDLETNIVAVERVNEYTSTPTEAAWIIDNSRPPSDWPDKGTVQFSHYTMRYREDLPPALNDVSFVIEGEHSLGVVGRTGAGKSSLAAALFRLVEPDALITTPLGQFKPQILIDGIDIGTVGLHDIRSKLTIIPQDPILFSGTLRFNLDPFEEKSDAEIWDCLNNAHLKVFVSSLPNTIDYEISEYGENLSLGQRQLVCLARALLRNTKILLLDEATAAVDINTDELIQQTIRKVFARTTVLTIAHRLNTVVDYDRIMVLDHGKVAEFDSPTNLVHDKTSHFYSMCAEAGLI